VYDIDEATSYVADRLPPNSQARLTYEELKKMLVLHMRWLHEKGLQPVDVIDRRQNPDWEVVVGEESLTAYLLGQAEGARIDLLDDVDVVHVVREHLNYFDAIGAIGPSASSSER
jgi:hypothetical protein